MKLPDNARRRLPEAKCLQNPEGDGLRFQRLVFTLSRREMSENDTLFDHLGVLLRKPNMAVEMSGGNLYK